MRNYFLAFFVLLAFVSNSQETNAVSVIGVGYGKNENDAISSALRNSIEKSVGVFIVSSTEVVNNQLVKDQINSVATGNIIDYSLISLLKDESGYKATVSANISPDKLAISLNNQVGSKFEVKGNVYAQNAIKESFYKEEEPLVIKSFMDQYESVPFFDISVHMAEPKSSLNFDGDVTDFDIYRKGMNDSVTNMFKNKIVYASEKTNRALEKKLLTDVVQVFKPDCPKEIAKYLDKDQVMEYERKAKLCAFKEDSRVHFYLEDLGGGSVYKKDFFIDFLFFPKINKNYVAFVEGLVKMLNEISITDLEAYSKISKSPPIIVSFSSIELISADVIKDLTAIHQFLPTESISSLPKSLQKEMLGANQDVDGYFFYLRNQESIELLKSFFGLVVGKKMMGSQNYTSDVIDLNKLENVVGKRYPALYAINGAQFLNPKEKVVRFFPFIQIDPTGASKLTYEPFIIRKTLTTEELNNIKSLEFIPIKH